MGAHITKKRRKAPSSPQRQGTHPFLSGFHAECYFSAFMFQKTEDGENTNWKTATKNNKH